MHVLRILLVFTVCLWLPISSPAATDAFKNGDIIFQKSISFQSEALMLATRSPYTHCGLIFFKGDKPYVFEAIRTVTWTPLENWIARDVEGHYVAMRLKQPLANDELARLRKAALTFEGKGYDLFFNWSDEAIYCSELIWKAYDRGLGIQLTPLKTFRDYDLDHEKVQKIVKERFHYDIPQGEKAVAPSDIMESPLLETLSLR